MGSLQGLIKIIYGKHLAWLIQLSKHSFNAGEPFGLNHVLAVGSHANLPVGRD